MTNKKPTSFRLNPESIELLDYTVNRAGLKNRTNLLEQALHEYCDYLNEVQNQKERKDDEPDKV